MGSGNGCIRQPSITSGGPGEPRSKAIGRRVAYHGTTMGALSINGCTELRTPSSRWCRTRCTYEVRAPPDLERIFGLTDGSIFQGEQGLDQMAFMRPSPLLAQYATPVHGLSLAGAATHPGGRVMAACGHNGAVHPQGPTARARSQYDMT